MLQRPLEKMLLATLSKCSLVKKAPLSVCVSQSFSVGKNDSESSMLYLFPHSQKLNSGLGDHALGFIKNDGGKQSKYLAC